MYFLALGVPIPWAHAGPADFTPLVAIVTAVLIMRFVIGIRITMMTFMLAAAAGALWAYAAQQWGLVVPTAVVLLAIPVLYGSVQRAHIR